MGQCGLRILGVKERPGCLSVAEFPGIRVGKLAVINEPMSGLSAWFCHKLQTVAQLGSRSPSRGPGSGRTTARPTPSGASKQGRVPEIEMLGHRPGDHRVQPETWETGMINCFFLRAHRGVGL